MKVPLAISSYDQLSVLGDEGGILNLSWTLDERGCLSAELDEVIAGELAAEAREGLPFTNQYLVRDPYGEAILKPAVDRFFCRSSWSVSVTCGAGVISVLHGLARLVRGQVAYVIGDTYPDFPHWVDQCGGSAVAGSGGSETQAIAAEIERHDPVIVFLERPSLTGDRLADLAEVESLCATAAAHNALVVIDESNANYWPPAFSAANVADAVANLVVVRGFSKAYGLGGLRLSYCVASPATTEAVRMALPPLLPASVSLRVGAAVLELGDLTDDLRQQIVSGKTELRRALERLGLEITHDSSEFLPYVLLDGDFEAIRSRLHSVGILGKAHLIWPGTDQAVRSLHRLSAPLAPARVELLRQKTGRASPASR